MVCYIVISQTLQHRNREVIMVCYIVISQTLQHRNREVIMVCYIVVSQNNNTGTGRLSWCVIL